MSRTAIRHTLCALAAATLVCAIATDSAFAVSSNANLLQYFKLAGAYAGGQDAPKGLTTRQGGAKTHHVDPEGGMKINTPNSSRPTRGTPHQMLFDPLLY